MNFHRHNNRRRPRRISLLVAFVVFGVLLFGINTFTNGSVAALVRAPVAAVWSAENSVSDGARSIQVALTSKEAVHAENKVLRERIEELELYAINNMVLKSENDELRALLGVESEQRFQGILARILSDGGVLPYGTISISRETQAPYVVGSYVYGANNVVIGRIDHVAGTSALVRLLSAPGEETKVVIGRDDRLTAAVLVGHGYGNFVLEIARDADIREDDPVVLLGEERSLVGFVGAIETVATDAFQTVRVRTPLNLDTIRFVRVR